MVKCESRIDKRKKLFVVNTYQNRNTLHINDGRCRHARRTHGFSDFDDEGSAMRAFSGNLRKCLICFRQELSMAKR